MSARSVDRASVDAFRAVVERRFGLAFDDHRGLELEALLRERARAYGRDAAAYVHHVSTQGASADDEETALLAERLTVGETFFFRNPDHFRALVERVLPERAAERGADRPLRVLSAGCASGEEPYTIAICATAARAEAEPWRLEITGADLNPAALARAAQGRYARWSLRATPAEVRARWFTPEGDAFVLAPEIRRLVAFAQVNLAAASIPLLKRASYDVVFCRNVLMYFAPRAAVDALQRVVDALAPGGFLFLGHAEHPRAFDHRGAPRGLASQLELCSTHDTFYYRRGGRAVQAPVTGAARPRGLPGASTEPSWVDAIAGATRRIAQLREATPATPVASEPAEKAQVLDALGEQRWEDALSAVDALRDRDLREALLLRAVALTNLTRLAEATAACEELLAIDDQHPGARYLLALHAQHAGELDTALDHARVAAYLDPTFALAQLQVGLLSMRAGDLGAAHRALRDAESRLAHEEQSRILLYGGGFSREALLKLCRDERARGTEKP